MVNGIIAAVIAVVVTAAIVTLARAKAKGQKCLGCSASGSCECCCKRWKDDGRISEDFTWYWGDRTVVYR